MNCGNCNIDLNGHKLSLEQIYQTLHEIEGLPLTSFTKS